MTRHSSRLPPDFASPDKEALVHRPSMRGEMLRQVQGIWRQRKHHSCKLQQRPYASALERTGSFVLDDVPNLKDAAVVSSTCRLRSSKFLATVETNFRAPALSTNNPSQNAVWQIQQSQAPKLQQTSPTKPIPKAAATIDDEIAEVFTAGWPNPHFTVLQNICIPFIGLLFLLIIVIILCGFEVPWYVTFVPGICFPVCWLVMGNMPTLRAKKAH
jgi:hypothetical protein